MTVSAQVKHAERESDQCCALDPGLPNASRCIEPGFHGWHYCEKHLRHAGELIATGMIVVEFDEQSPIRRTLNS